MKQVNDRAEADWFFLAFMGGILVFMIFFALGVAPVERDVAISVTSKEIVSLSDDSLIHGRFSLGSGSIDQEPKYFYYAGGAREGYYLEWVDTYRTRVFMDEDKRPYIREIQFCNRNVFKTCTAEPESVYQIHVPNNTIIREYRLDGKV